jgi:putative transposase
VGKEVSQAIEEKPRSGQPPKLTDSLKAHITAIACSEPPVGRDHWSLKMISDKVMELGYVEHISTEAVRKYLKKSSSSPGRRSAGSLVR